MDEATSIQGCLGNRYIIFFSYSLPIFIIYIRLLNSNLDIRIKLKSIQSRVKYVSGTPLFCFSFVTVFSVRR